MEKCGYVSGEVRWADSCSVPVMTIDQGRLTCSQEVNKGGNKRLTGGVNEMLTGCSPDVNRAANEELTGGVNSELTDGVNRSLTLSTTNNNKPILQSNINPWGVPNEYLWGDVLRGEK